MLPPPRRSELRLVTRDEASISVRRLVPFPTGIYSPCRTRTRCQTRVRFLGDKLDPFDSTLTFDASNSTLTLTFDTLNLTLALTCPFSPHFFCFSLKTHRNPGAVLLTGTLIGNVSLFSSQYLMPNAGLQSHKHDMNLLNAVSFSTPINSALTSILLTYIPANYT